MTWAESTEKNSESNSDEGVDHATQVVVTDIKVPFWPMVFFMVKWVIASIPAMIILGLIVRVIVTMLGGVGTLLISR